MGATPFPHHLHSSQPWGESSTNPMLGDQREFFWKIVQMSCFEPRTIQSQRLANASYLHSFRATVVAHAADSGCSHIRLGEPPLYSLWWTVSWGFRRTPFWPTIAFYIQTLKSWELCTYFGKLLTHYMSFLIWHIWNNMLHGWCDNFTISETDESLRSRDRLDPGTRCKSKQDFI